MTDQIEGYISLRHPTERGEWALFFEFQPGTGVSATSGRRWDALAVSCWGATKGHRIAYEVKRSRGDFRRELENREKRALAESLCHETWFCVHPGVCSVDEVPYGWGLMVVNPENGAAHYPRAARTREKVETPDTFVAALARRGAEEDRPTGRCWPRGVWKYAGIEIPEAELAAFCDSIVKGRIETRVAEAVREKLGPLEQRAARLDDIMRILKSYGYTQGDQWGLSAWLSNLKPIRLGDVAAQLRMIADRLDRAEGT
jgi:hypothetical protein